MPGAHVDSPEWRPTPTASGLNGDYISYLLVVLENTRKRVGDILRGNSLYSLLIKKIRDNHILLARMEKFQEKNLRLEA